jgi:hypothetical protein
MAGTPATRWQSFCFHKEGNAPDEYEDAFAANPNTGRFAVADGASESSFASLWAKLLVEGFVARRQRRTPAGWLPPLRQRWAEAVDPLELDWFAEDKRQLGAFATFLGLSIQRAPKGAEGRWKAVAIGDCCLFQIRDDRLFRAFPIRRSADFGNRPALLGSRAVTGQPAGLLGQAKQRVGRWQACDRFLLTTDALAQWFLRRQEQRRKPWQSLLRRLAGPDPTNALTAYVGRLRSRKALKNDDVTLLVIDL